MLKIDCGNENELMATLQWAISQDLNIRKYGKSIANPRSENFWSQFAVANTHWLISSSGGKPDEVYHLPDEASDLLIVAKQYLVKL